MNEDRESYTEIYYESSNLPAMKMCEVEDFKKLVKSFGSKVIYCSKHDNRVNGFMIIHESVAFYIQSQGFETYSDRIQAAEEGFISPLQFYSAKRKELGDSKEYKEFQESGFKTVKEFKDAQKTIIPTLFKIYQENFTELYPNKNKSRINNMAQFVHILSRGGFSSEEYDEALKMYKAGFWNKEDYRKYKASDYNSPKDYDTGVKFELSDSKELSKLNEMGIEDVSCWKRFKSLESKWKAEGFSDGIGYYASKLLLQTNPKDPFPVGQLITKLNENMIRPIQIKSGIYLDFVQEKNNESRMNMLLEHEDLKNTLLVFKGNLYKKYFNENEKTTALIDVSNVVNFFSTKEERKANVQLLHILVTELKKLKIDRIIGFADATLPHDIGEMEFEKIKKIMDLSLAQKNQPADPYILDYAENNPCCIISNDQYRDWYDREHHPWRSENVSRILIDFTFDKDRNLSLNARKKAEF